MQVKLLRVLQQKKVTRVGGTEPIALDVRVIAATNRNLEQMVREGTFREDLYYRLNVVSIFIPPLRERREDIIPLINHFLMVENQKYHTNKSIYSDTIDAFEGYCWPGNVRELENLLGKFGDYHSGRHYSAGELATEASAASASICGGRRGNGFIEKRSRTGGICGN